MNAPKRLPDHYYKHEKTQNEPISLQLVNHYEDGWPIACGGFL